MLNLRISQKLLLMSLLTTGMAIALISAVIQYSMTSGFNRYLAQTEFASIDLLPQLLEAEYKEQGDWQKVFADPTVMARLIAQNENQHNPRFSAPPLGGNEGPPGGTSQLLDPNPPGDPDNEYNVVGPLGHKRQDESVQIASSDIAGRSGPIFEGLRSGASKSVTGEPGHGYGNEDFRRPGAGGRAAGDGPPPPYPPFRMDLFKRIGVFDRDGALLWGAPSAKGSDATLDLHCNGSVVGSLRLAQSETLNGEFENSFVEQQNRNIFLVSILAMVAASAVAIFFSRDLIKAIDALLQVTRELIAGNLNVRSDLSRVDELGQLSRDLNTLASTLEQHDRSHKQWMTDTSHELRTPVAVLRAQVEALQDGVQEPNQRTLAVLHDEVMVLGKMIDDLHDLARYDAKQLNLALIPADVGAILMEQIEAFDERFQKKSVKVDTSSIKDLHCIISVDPFRIKQLFVNLLENSLRYTDEGGQLKITSSIEDKFLLLNFDDSEPGVPQELLLSIFERFYRVESSRSRVYGGSGLGLAICKTVAEGHGGAIRALPSPLGGLRVELKLPLMEKRQNEQG